MAVDALGVLAVEERMGGRTKANDWLASFNVIDDVFHVFIGEFTEPQLQHKDISIVHQMQARYVRKIFWIDLPGIWILAEEHDGFVSVGAQQAERASAVLLQNDTPHRQRPTPLAFHVPAQLLHHRNT